MNRPTFDARESWWARALGTSIVFILFACGAIMPAARSQQKDANQDRAILKIRELGGKLDPEEIRTGKPVTIVNLNRTRVTDADLVILKGLPRLSLLSLDSTRITDAALDHLKGLSSLRVLSLNQTQVSDSSLAKLKGLTGLSMLFLLDTPIHDAGLTNLKGLNHLEGPLPFSNGSFQRGPGTPPRVDKPSLARSRQYECY